MRIFLVKKLEIEKTDMTISNFFINKIPIREKSTFLCKLGFRYFHRNTNVRFFSLLDI